MDVRLLSKQRLEELGLEQKDLAAATTVTESHISQLLTQKKSPPAPERTDIYERMAKPLNLPSDQLSTLADLQRKEESKTNLMDPPAPLFKEVRAFFSASAHPKVRANSVRSSRGSPSANSNASSP